MYVVVEHTITNPDVFFELPKKVAAAPPGFNALQFLPEHKQISEAVCLWEAKSCRTL